MFVMKRKEKAAVDLESLRAMKAVGQVKHSRFVRLKVKGMRERKFLFPGSTMGIRGIRAGGK